MAGAGIYSVVLVIRKKEQAGKAATLRIENHRQANGFFDPHTP